MLKPDEFKAFLKNVQAMFTLDPGGALPKAGKVRVEREDGIVYEWQGEGAEAVRDVIGRALAAGETIPPPRCYLPSCWEPENPDRARLLEGARKLASLVYPCRSEKDSARNSQDARKILANLFAGKAWDGSTVPR